MGASDNNQAAPKASLARRTGRFLLLNPLTRVAVGFVMVGGAVALVQQVGGLVHPAGKPPPTAGGVLLTGLSAILAAGGALAAYALFVRLYEHRWPAETALDRLPRWLPAGFAVGAALLAASAGLIHACGWSAIERTADRSNWAGLVGAALAFQLGVAVFEEVLLRGVLFRVVEQSLGSWAALALSALLFGLLHTGNPNATWAAALGLSLQAGVLLGAAYMVSRSLWFPIGLHWAWNATQAGVVGGTVSGHAGGAVITTRPTGPDLLSGGAFGVEGSVLSTAICAALAAGLCLAAVRLGRTKPGFWSVPGESRQAEPGAAADPAS
jgi:membrane protease YdiL (CAAX protease family)